MGAVVDPSIDFDLDQETIGRVQMFVVHRILTDLAPDDVDRLLTEADEITARHAQQG